jgi:osmotically-inducible protein OsmY
MKQIPMAAVLVAGCSLWIAGAHPGPSSQPPQDQGAVNLAQADRSTTQRIRKAIVNDKNLSTYAHNVVILAHDGKVILRGPVRSSEEEQMVMGIASAVVGPENVIDELTIAPPK